VSERVGGGGVTIFRHVLRDPAVWSPRALLGVAVAPAIPNCGNTQSGLDQ
jgi:hypothetical protein